MNHDVNFMKEESNAVPVGEAWLVEVRKYEGHVLVNRR